MRAFLRWRDGATAVFARGHPTTGPRLRRFAQNDEKGPYGRYVTFAMGLSHTATSFREMCAGNVFSNS